MKKKLYEEVLIYIKEWNVTIEKCILNELDLNSFELDVSHKFTSEDKNIYLRLLMLNVLAKECTDGVLDFLIQLESENKDVLFVCCNILKKYSKKNDLSKEQEIKIMNKCKSCWCFGFLRGTLSHILSTLSHNECFLDIFNFEFLLRYNLCTKEMFYSDDIKTNKMFDVSNTLAGAYSVRVETYNLPLLVTFLENMNCTNYKYLKKTLLALDIEMYRYLPVKYTELGLKNLTFIVKDYDRLNNNDRSLKKYLKDCFNLQSVLFSKTIGVESVFTDSNIIKKEILNYLSTANELFEFYKFNVYIEDEDLIDFLCSKIKMINFEGCLEIQRKFSALSIDCLTSIFPYRRVLGIKVLEALDVLDTIDYDLTKDLIFDISNIVRKHSKKLRRRLDISLEEIIDVLNGSNNKDITPIFDYIRDKKVYLSEICEMAKLNIDKFLINKHKFNVNNSLLFLIEFEYSSCKPIVDRLKTVIINSSDNLEHSNCILKTLCWFYYHEKDTAALVDILLYTEDLGVLLVIDKYLDKLGIDYSEEEINQILNQLPYNNKWIRKSGGYSVIFKSICKNKKSYILELVMKNIKIHLKCIVGNCKVSGFDNSRMCEDILYHNYSILFSIVDHMIINLDMLKLCFNGLKSSNWIIKNNSLQLFKIIYGQIDSIEFNLNSRQYIKEQFRREIDKEKQTIFNGLIFCLVLLLKSFSCLNEEETKLIEEIKQTSCLLPLETKENINIHDKFIYSLIPPGNCDLKNDFFKHLKNDCDTNLLRKIVLCFVSEDFENQIYIKEKYFGDFCFTKEKLIYEIIKKIFHRGQLREILNDLEAVNKELYDVNYIKHIANDFL